MRLLRERGTLTKADGPAIELYVQTYCRWRACIAEIESKGDFVDVQFSGADGVVFTKRTPNPASKLAGQIGNSLRAMQVQLGATPGSREKAKKTTPDPKKEFPIGSAGWLAQKEKEKNKNTEVFL